MSLVLTGEGISFLALIVVIPVLPIYLRDHLGADGAEIGLVMGAPSLTAVIARPVAGLLADLRGPRFAFGLGAALLSIAGALYPLCTSTMWFTADRLLLGLGQGATMAAATVWVVDLASADRKGRALGLVGMVNYLVMGVGAVLGGVIVSLTGQYWPAWALAAGLPAVALVLSRMTPGSPPIRTDQRTPTRAGWAASLTPVISPGISLALTFFAYAALASFVVVALDERGISNGMLVLTGYAVAVIATRLFLGWVPDQLGIWRSLAIACTTAATGLLAIAVAGNLIVAMFGGALAGMGMALIYPALGLRVIRDTEGTPRRQTAIAAFGSFVDIGVGLGAPLLGLVARQGGYGAAFVVAAALMIAAFLLQARTRSATEET